MLSFEIAFIFIAILSLPNLIYRAQFDVPLLLFIAICRQTYSSTCSYLFLLSICFSLYRTLLLFSTQNDIYKQQQKPVLLAITALVFVLKICMIFVLMIYDHQFKKSIMFEGIANNIQHAFDQLKDSSNKQDNQ